MINHQVQIRPAVAMIELIFAIVVMAIVLLSAPNLISQSTKSTFVALQQESINAAATHLNIVMTKEWDQGNADLTTDPRVLRVTSGNSGLRNFTATNGRAGTSPQSYRRFLTGSGLSPFASTSFGVSGDSSVSDAVPFDDVDDYDQNVTRLRIVESANDYQSDYKDRFISMLTTVRYVSDTPDGSNYNTSQRVGFDNPFESIGGGSTNIKAISVTLSTDTAQVGEALDKNITLSSFMCNIGHYKFATPRDVN